MSYCDMCMSMTCHHMKARRERNRTSKVNQPAPVETRVEWCGNIQVHHPVKQVQS